MKDVGKNLGKPWELRLLGLSLSTSGFVTRLEMNSIGFDTRGGRLASEVE